MVDPAGFGSRFAFAWSLQAHHEGVRQIPLAKVGERIAKRMGRPEGFPAGTVSRWAAGKNIPQDLEVIGAAALETGVDPGWLAFGRASDAPWPAGWQPPAETGHHGERSLRFAEPEAEAEGQPAALPITDDVTRHRALESARKGLDASAELEGSETPEKPRRRGAKGKRRGSGGG